MFSNAIVGFGEDPQPQYGDIGFDMNATDPTNPRVLEPAADWIWTDADEVAANWNEPGASSSASGGGSGAAWAAFLSPLVNAGAQFGLAYGRQQLLAPSTYVLNPKTGQIAIDAQGHPILANSSEGVRIAKAMKDAKITTQDWLMPVAIGVGVLAIGLLVMKRGRR